MKRHGKRTIATAFFFTTLLILSACKDTGDGSGNGADLASAFNGSSNGDGGSNAGSGSSGSGSGSGSGDSPPTISGSPRKEIKIGDNYSFTPTVEEPDGDSLTFYLGNQPRWMNFSTKSGKLSGSPGPGDVGIYTNIQIAVSDGSTVVYMPSFSVDVTQTGTGSATISWTAPTQNTDGSALTDLAAYKIYYGVNRDDYTNQVRINNPGITTYVVDNLTPATYFFVSTSINSSGVESEFSNVARKTVN